jgi:hypothetical protein
MVLVLVLIFTVGTTKGDDWKGGRQPRLYY